PKGTTLKDDFNNILALDFDSIVAAHGLLLKGTAKEALTEKVRKIFD
ncbi:MAG: hypothetical protein ACJAZ6_001879, partial [Oleispira sp.]